MITIKKEITITISGEDYKTLSDICDMCLVGLSNCDREIYDKLTDLDISNIKRMTRKIFDKE